MIESAIVEHMVEQGMAVEMPEHMPSSGRPIFLGIVGLRVLGEMIE
jgi:hypothetical protein